MTVETGEEREAKSNTEKNCESCGNGFSCGASSGFCWCFTVNLSPENIAGLRDKYENCLCENCLNRLDFSVDGERK